MSTATPTCTWEDAVLRLRSDPANQALVEACFYDDPLLAAAERYFVSTEWQAVRRLVGTAGGRALDIGAGRGISSFALAKDGWAVTALEPDDSAVVGAGAIRSLAADSALRIDVVQQWGEQLPFATDSFDLVHCRQVLHHARDLGRFCAEVARVLAPGGRLIATREHVLTKREDLPRFLDAHPLHRLYGGESAYTLDEYTSAMAVAGLRVELILNPLASDINLYPDSKASVKERWSRRLKLPGAKLLPDALLHMVGSFSDTPGRLFSFLAVKPGAA